MENICIFGDSVSWGAWDREQGGWATRLWLWASQQENWKEIYNLSISGGTTETILARFENEARIRKAEGLIFQSAGNDCTRPGPDGDRAVSPDRYRQNVADIIARATQITPHILFIGLRDCDDARSQPVSWGDAYCREADVKAYNEIARSECVKTGVLFLDLFDLLGAEEIDDGIHPTAPGHEKIFTAVRDFLIEQQWL